MKKILTAIIIFCFTITSYSQVAISGSNDGAMKIRLLYSDIITSELNFSFDSFTLEKVKTGEGFGDVLGLEGAARLLKAAAPELLRSSASVVIPDDAMMEVAVTTSSYKDFYNIDIVPSKGNLTRDIDPSTVPYKKGPVYQHDAFYPGTVAELQTPYIVRDLRGQTVTVFPFQYNPVTKTLRVYYDITVRITKTGTGGENIFERQRQEVAPVSEYHKIYARHFINYQYTNINYTPLGEDGRMLVITYPAYASAMLPFVEWKNQSGIPCEMVTLNTTGTTASAIQSYVTNYYNTEGLTYLLLVGDAQHVPTKTTSNGHSDNAYAYIVGNDHYPEFFVGRFSAENTTHVATMVNRTLNYEKNPDLTPNWLTTVLGIASDEGPGDDNEYDYEHIRIMQNKMMNYTYTSNPEFFEGSQGGNDAPGDPSSAMVQTAINNGSGAILYTGHGSTTSWGTSYFNTTNINSLTNTNQLPFIWSVACVNGNFVNNTCFAEIWLRAEHNNEPTGAIATLMSTINQSWDPPMDGQDEMVDILVESYSNNIKRTFAGLSMNGCMKMNDTYGSAGDEITDTWVVFGDPSLAVRTDTPRVITAMHPAIMFIGASQFSLTANVNGAKATLSLNGQVLGYGLVNNGSANISFNAVTIPDTLDLVITAFNHIPYIAKVPVIVANSPYLKYFSHSVNDANSNNNNQADYNETVDLNMIIENIGIYDADSVTIVLSSQDPYITIVDSLTFINKIIDSSSVTLQNAFTVTLSNDVPDQHQALLKITMQDNANNIWQDNFFLNCNAPQLVIDTLYFDDYSGGNNNGKLEPGEVVLLTARVDNFGHSNSAQAILDLTFSNSYITVYDSLSKHAGVLSPNSPRIMTFIVKLDTTAPLGLSMLFDLSFHAGAYQASASITDMVNRGDEDWESGDFSQFSWMHGGDANWTITSSKKYEGVYSARSGIISHNQSTELSIDWHAAFADTISFWLSVSCEDGSIYSSKWDYLEFYIDGVPMDYWDGNKAWMMASYPVSQGTHTFTWKYIKDAYVSSGSDAAWIDLIKFPAAGEDVVLKPFIALKGIAFDDSNGNNDGYFTPGDTIDIGYNLQNVGFVESVNPTCTLTTANPLITFINNGTQLNTIQPNASLLTGMAHRFVVSTAAIANDKVDFVLTLEDDSANIWNIPFTMTLGQLIGIEDNPETESFFLYPNPATDKVWLAITAVENKKVNVNIFSIDGALQHTTTIFTNAGKNVLEIDLYNLNSGIYIIQLSDDNRVVSKKVIKR